MMRLLHAAAAVLILATSRESSAAQCLRPAERAAFGIAGLKSEMMVVALSCHREDRYNAAISRFRPQLVAADRAVTAWFSRVGNGIVLHDRYITELANAQSRASLESGDAFCGDHDTFFDAVMAAGTPAGLSAYVSAHPAVQPSAMPDCPASPARVTPAGAAPARAFVPATAMHPPGSP